MSKIKRVLICGNHTCGNRGDAAILRGLLFELREQLGDVEVDITSRFPESSKYLLGEHSIIKDELYSKLHGGQGFQAIKKAKKDILGIRTLEAKVREQGPLKRLPLPSKYEQCIQWMSTYDAIIQVGGSFFVDSYGIYQFEYALCAILANKPLLFIGHSVGPFGKRRFNEFSQTVFNRTQFLGLREEVSIKLLRDAIPLEKEIDLGTDTAWLVPVKEKRKTYLAAGRPCIAVSVRELAPFDRKLKVHQADYEQKMATLCDALVEKGYRIVIVSTCTGIDGYRKDDRMVALRVKKLSLQAESIDVVMDELNDVELGELLSECDLTVSTRLHCAIISMNFGTPAFALNYEHKSKGIMENLGLGELAVDFKKLMADELLPDIEAILEGLDLVKSQVASAVELERQKAKAFIARALASCP